MDLIHPNTVAEVADDLRVASADRIRLLIVGGRTHIDKGNPVEVDAELWTTVLDRPVAYDPAEMLCVVEAGVRIHDLTELLAEGGQEWPVDAPSEATVGGVIAADAALSRQLRVGTLRDTVVEMEMVTGDGRRVRSGARTVKNVTGFDLHRLLTGSLGTLGAITQVALKVRPLPKAARILVTSSGGVELGRRILETVPLPAAVLPSPDHVLVRLEGWPEEVAEQASALGGLTSFRDEQVFQPPLFPDAPIVAECAVAPSAVSAPICLRTVMHHSSTASAARASRARTSRSPRMSPVVPETPRSPLSSSTSRSRPSASRPFCRIRCKSTPGSTSPDRVLIMSPPIGVSPIVVSTHRPFRTAARLAPLPR